MAEQIVLFLFRKQCRISVSYAQTKGVICTQTIFAKLLYEMEKGRDTVLATIVWESGSAPRGAGAQMLVDAQGPQAGTIGGGNVDRWRKQGKITPCKRPGKVEYRTIELRTLQRLQQDYFK